MSNVQQQLVGQVDKFWDSWLSGVKATQSAQQALQKNALQVFSYQKEWLDYTVKAVQTFEAESKKITASVQAKVEEGVEQAKEAVEQVTPSVPSMANPFAAYSNPFTSVQQLAEQTQQFAWSQQYAFLDALGEVQKEVEAAATKIVEIQQHKAEEGYEQLASYTEELKKLQKALLQPSAVVS